MRRAFSLSDWWRVRALASSEFTGETFEEKQWQVAVAAIMTIVEGQLLLPVSVIHGMIHVQDDHRRRGGIAVDECVNERLGQAEDVFAGEPVLQAGKGWSGSQRSVLRTPECQFERRIVAQTVGIIAISVTVGTLKNSLA